MTPLPSSIGLLDTLLGVFVSQVSLSAILLSPAPAGQAPSNATDPCAQISAQSQQRFVPPAGALACLKSFPFNETRRQNVMAVASRAFDFYTFEDFYLDSPPPFQDSTVDIRAELARINSTQYATDYDFNQDLYYFTHQLNDGHTGWFPFCYTTFGNVLPAPLVSLEQNGNQSVFVAPDLVQLFDTVEGVNFTSYFDSMDFDWRRLAGAQVLEIEGMDAYVYADTIAATQSGNFLDHGVRVNSVFASYRVTNGGYSMRLGDIANPVFPDLESLTMKLVLPNATSPETVTVPFLAAYTGEKFTDQDSYWEENCAASLNTNGVDAKRFGSSAVAAIAKASITDLSLRTALVVPPHITPTLPQLNGSAGIFRSYILPDKKTGVMFVGSFEPDSLVVFQSNVRASMDAFQAANVTQLIIDVTNNNGGLICLGEFLHGLLVGSKALGNFSNTGFQSTMRANTLARKIVASDIELKVSGPVFYPPRNFAFLNNTRQPNDFNYLEASTVRTVNEQDLLESQRLLDTCVPSAPFPETPLFAPGKIAIVSNGNCASTCAMFSTIMKERHNATIAVFGGKPGLPMQFKGMAGNQVLDWKNLDTEIKTANLKDDPLAPPDLIVNGNFRINWRIAYSFLNETVPIEYLSELPDFQFPYTANTYDNPQTLWTFAAKTLFT